RLHVVLHDADGAEPERFGSAALDSAIRHFSQRLVRLGVRPGHCVLYQGHQSVDALISFWATVLIGGIFAPVDPEWPAYLGVKAREKAKPVVILADPDCMSFWQDNASVPVMCSSEAFDNTASTGNKTPGLPAQVIPSSSIAAYLFTSGSTGDPKAVMLSHEALARSAGLATQTFHWLQRETLVNLAEPHTMSGLRNGFLAAPLAGSEWAIRPAWARSSIFGLIEFLTLSQPHRLVAAPVLLRHLNLLGERLDTSALHRLAAFYCTGADLRNEDVKAFFERHRIPVINYYGLTETVGLCLCQSPSDWTAEDDSLGKAVGCETRIDESASTSSGIGELLVKQPYPMSGYLGDLTSTAMRFDGEWLKTGDLATQTPDGRIRLVGRIDSFIKTAGTDRLYPQEVETVLESHEKVLEAACLGIPDNTGTERVTALVVVYGEDSEPESLVRALHDHTRQHLGIGRSPTQIRIVSALPRTSNGKLQRNKLKDIVNAN
ncbi:MAG: class I adenylate-forming enzyme family protein, partial [Salinisphaeraceae bacterium]|nr:class I adenylate-forming enzyme family protein [Salinisphaeraceae bacterium]